MSANPNSHGARRRFVAGLVRRLGTPQCDVEDVVQDVFEIFFRRFQSAESEAAARALLSAISARVCANQRRKSARRKLRLPLHELGAEPDQFAPEEEDLSQEAMLEAKEARSLLTRALSRLDAPKREVLILAEIEALTLREIAVQIRIPCNTVASRLRAARSNLDRAVRVLSVPPRSSARTRPPGLSQASREVFQ
ncbi:MAG TPA: RNA polymerase sigma factor [Polyangiaceae bacterium]|nr:RNA polymerase sigma factor [Polyangiaceae bacterium]